MLSSLDQLPLMLKSFLQAARPTLKRRRRDRTQTRTMLAMQTSHHSRVMTHSATAAGPGVVAAAAQRSALSGTAIKAAAFVTMALGGRVGRTGPSSRPAVRAGGMTIETPRINGDSMIEGVRHTATVAASKASGGMIRLLLAAVNMTTEVLLSCFCPSFNLLSSLQSWQ